MPFMGNGGKHKSLRSNGIKLATTNSGIAHYARVPFFLPFVLKRIFPDSESGYF